MINFPEPVPHQLAEVWDNAAALVTRVCQRCGETFDPPTLIAHPDDDRAAVQRVADRGGHPVMLSPYLPQGTAILFDPLVLDLAGCQPAAQRAA